MPIVLIAGFCQFTFGSLLITRAFGSTPAVANQAVILTNAHRFCTTITGEEGKLVEAYPALSTWHVRLDTVQGEYHFYLNGDGKILSANRDALTVPKAVDKLPSDPMTEQEAGWHFRQLITKQGHTVENIHITRIRIGETDRWEIRAKTDPNGNEGNQARMQLDARTGMLDWFAISRNRVGNRVQ